MPDGGLSTQLACDRSHRSPTGQDDLDSRQRSTNVKDRGPCRDLSQPSTSLRLSVEVVTDLSWLALLNNNKSRIGHGDDAEAAELSSTLRSMNYYKSMKGLGSIVLPMYTLQSLLNHSTIVDDSELATANLASDSDRVRRQN